mgnify:CR=1 FL=1
MPIISLLSDFGLKDSYVSQMKAVILSINPRAVMVDLTHEIPKYDIRAGAFALASAALYFPKGTVHMAVVDPGVGGKRKPIIVQTEKSLYVGPDNGLLILAAKSEKIHRVFEITQKRFMRQEISPTFHGRDIFSPVAAYLSKGISADRIGKVLKTYFRPRFSSPIIHGRVIDCEVLHVDSFGNVVTNVRQGDLNEVGVKLGSRMRFGKNELFFHRTYSDVAKGSLLGLVGSHGFFEISANQVNAARLLHLKTGMRLRLSAMR